MPGKEPRERLQDEGVVFLQGAFSLELLTALRAAADNCFAAIEVGRPVPGNYGYSPYAHSVLLNSLLDFGLENQEALTAPLGVDGLADLFSILLDGPWRCRLDHSWVRKKFAPENAPKAGYSIQDWHQDGALGARFPPEPGPLIPPASLATCWIPLGACGRESPGLEFIRNPQPVLLHFSELNDAALRQRFDNAAFWVPELDFGDGLVFRNDVLHRTHVTDKMRTDRLSVEYRIFPQNP